MADDSSLFRLYLNQRYRIKYRQKNVHHRNNYFENYNNWSQNEDQIKTLFHYYPDKPCDEIENKLNKKCSRHKKREYLYKRSVSHNLTTTSSDPINSKYFNNKYGLPTLKQSKNIKLIVKGSKIMKRKSCNNKYTVNVISEYNVPCGNSNPFHNPSLQAKIKIYRCQLSTKEESCCCSCNSDAMFEVMKSLYDCYKKKNCDHCNCILCGHLPRQERRLGEVRKSAAAMKTASAKEKAQVTKAALAEMQGKSPAEKEKILKELAMKNVPLPKGRTPSENELIKKVRAEVGLPPEPETAADKQKYKKAEAKGLIIPLEGKSPAEKEKILKKQAKLGLPLPKGRSPSEKALIQKVQNALGKDVKVSSEKLPKTEGLGQRGMPSPEGKTPTERKLIDKGALTPSAKEKYNKALAAGLITPLKGKTSAQKKKILQGLADFGLPLPEGDTPSEKALIAKVAATAKQPSVISIPSEKLRKAKAAGLITPLKGKTPEQKAKILTGLAKQGIPLPEPTSASERKLIDKVRKDLGLPPEPKTIPEREKYKKAMTAGLITPLADKTQAQKEKILRGQADLGLPLPEGRTPSEKALIAKVAATARPPSVISVLSEKLRKAKAAGLITPLKGKTPEQKAKILTGLAKQGIPLPEPTSASERKLIDKVRKDLGLPPEPKTIPEREKYKKAMTAGLITPLADKTQAQKEKILRGQADLGLPLPEGRTPSEKALIAKVAATAKPPSVISVPSERLRKAKAAGLITPLKGKTPEQKAKILTGLAKHGIPLPEPTSASERKLIDKVRKDLGLPPEPKTIPEREKYKKAMTAGLITPLADKTQAQKEKILRGQADLGLPLPEGRTPSEKALIAKVAATARPPSVIPIPSEKLRTAKAAGLITPLTKKTPEQKEKILRGLAAHGIPLPQAKTPSEKKIIDKVRKDMGLPPEPKSSFSKEKYDKAIAAGLITPLNGKTKAQKEKILKGQANLGIPLPDGRTPSEKAMIAQLKAESPKTIDILSLPPAQRKKLDEKTAKVMKEGKGPSDECICPQLTPKADLVSKLAQISMEPRKIASEKLKAAKTAGLITPLEGKSAAQKEKILRGQAKLGLPLPEGRTPSEKALIAKVAATTRPPSVISVPSEKLRKAKAAGLITPLKGKTPEQKAKILTGLAKHGIPLPEPTSASERKLMDKVRKDMGLPPEPKTIPEREKYKKAMTAGLITPLADKTQAQKEKILRGQADLGLPLPEGRTPSEKALIAKVAATVKPPSVISVPSEKLRKAKAAGLITPLKGKTPEQKAKILTGLAKHGIPLPEPTSASERKLIDKVRKDLGLPPEPKTIPEREKYKKAMTAGLITPLADKTQAQKEKILRGQADLGLPLPEGRTPSEKALIAKVAATARPPSVIPIPSEKLRKAKAAGLITPLQGKTPEQKAKILTGLAKQGIPLPEPTSASERKLIDKVRKDLGLPPEPKTIPEREKYKKAMTAGLITPLTDKTQAQKEKILRGQADLGLPLPEGRTPSEKALIAKVAATARPPSVISVPSEKLRKAKAAGLITPLKGKSPKQQAKILTGLAKQGIPLPEPTSASERKLIDKVRKDMGLSPEPKTIPEREKYKKAMTAGLITPLADKTQAQKEKILRGQADLGLPLPEGRTPSEKALIAKVAATARPPSVISVPSEKLRKAKAAGLITPLKGKTPEQKEKILTGLAKHGIPLPEPTTASERKLWDKVRKEMGLPPEPKSIPDKEKYKRATAAGLITPLQGKTKAQKEKILKRMAEEGIPLPAGRTPSEKSLIGKIQSKIEAKPQQKGKVGASAKKLDLKTAKVMKEGKGPSDECICSLLTPDSEKELKKVKPSGISLEKLRKGKTAGLPTSLKGQSPEQKEKILRDLAQNGIMFPEPKTASETKLMDKVRKDLGLPPQPETPSAKKKYNKAQAAGLIIPLEGKTMASKEKILKKQAEIGLSLPEGRTSSEKALIDKIKATTAMLPSETPSVIPSEKMRKAKAAGLLTPLEGKSPKQKEKQLRELAKLGLPLPEGKTPSEKSLIHKVKTELGIPPGPSEKEGKLGKIKTKSKKDGAISSKKSARARPPPPGIKQEFEDIIKTTTCDRGCGCDKKKIRFKHSYVKIKVTSPDISSLCPCPEECIPGVKAGVFTDNEGIKVTVGRALGVPSLPSYAKESNPKLKQKEVDSEKTLKCIYLNKQAVSVANRDTVNDTRESSVKMYGYFQSDVVKTEKKNINEYAINCTSESDASLPLDNFYNKNTKEHSYIYGGYLHNNFYNMNTCNYGSTNNCRLACFSVDSYAAPIFSETFRVNSYFALSSTTSSFDSILIVKTESSLSLTTNSYYNENTTISMISFKDYFSSHVSQYLASAHSVYIDFDMYNNDSIAETKKYISDNDNNTESNKSENCGFYTCSIENYQTHTNVCKKRYLKEFIYRASSESTLNIKEVSKLKRRDSSIVIVSNINKDEDIIGVINEIVNGKKLEKGSSVYIIMTCSDQDTESITDSNSTICLQLSNVCHEYNNKIGPVNINKQPMTHRCPYGLKFNYGRKDKKIELKTPKTKEKLNKCEIMKTKDSGTNEELPKADIKLLNAERAKCSVGMDTTEDRPCCCCPKAEVIMHVNESDNPGIGSALSDLIIPMMTKESEAQGLRKGIIKGNISKCHTSYSKSVVIKTPPVPVKVCNVPPCKNPQVATMPRMVSQSTTCLLGDLVNLTEKMGQEIKKMTVCEDTKEIKCGGGAPCPKKVKENMCAGQCSHMKINDGRTVRCQCGGKEKKVKLKRLCPCDVYTKQIQPRGAAPCGGSGCGGVTGETEDTKITKKPCMCDQKKPEKKNSKKNTICECPLLPSEPETQLQSQAESVNQNENDLEHYNDFEWVDVKEVKKMKSDLTQTTSGFTLDVVRRPPIQEEISFEQALEYFGIQQPSPTERDEGCSCDDPVAVTGPPSPLPSGIDCLCPGEEASAAEPESGQYGQEGQEPEAGERPLKGIRLTIDGKGSGSPGLAGICCFEMIQEANRLYLPPAKSISVSFTDCQRAIKTVVCQ